MNKVNRIRRQASLDRERWTSILKDAETKNLRSVARLARKKLHAVSRIQEVAR